MKKIVFVCLLIGLVSSDTKKSEELEAFTHSQVTPDVVHTPPQKLLKIEYEKSDKEVELGNELAPKDVREIPKVTYTGEPHSYYTLIMTDPDAPSRQKHSAREWNHWLVVNIPGSDVTKGEVLTEYVGSAPPKDTGLHRYVFLLYKQPGKLTFNEEHKTKTDGKRAKFNTENFVKKYNLGSPVAGNFFKARFDDSVPEIHKQLAH